MITKRDNKKIRENWKRINKLIKSLKILLKKKDFIFLYKKIYVSKIIIKLNYTNIQT